MEQYMMDDHMEVVSSHFGPQGEDDIEIDLDIQHDHIGHDDQDIIVEDVPATADYPNTSENFNEFSKDADMLDDDYIDIPTSEQPASYGTLKWEHDTPTTHNEGIYEEEMADDYEEDIDAPIPDDHIEYNEGDEAPTTEIAPSLNAESTQVPDGGNPTEVANDDIEHHIPNESNIPTLPEPDSHLDVQGQSTQIDGEEHKELEHSIRNVDEITDNNLNPELPQTSPSPKAEQEVGEARKTPRQESVPTSNHDFHEQPDTGPAEAQHEVQAKEIQSCDEGNFETGPEIGDANQEEHEVLPPPTSPEGIDLGAENEKASDHTPLPRITVLYSYNEMSLFPPHGDDPSEMYLLENEDVAHAPLHQLFRAFRRVLGDNITKDDELILSIDCLNLQLSEINVQSSEVTLSQIVQLYLDLNRNDGSAASSGSLYISLDSRPTLEAEIATLQAAAESGKGLSMLQYDLTNHSSEIGENEASVENEHETDSHHAIPADSEIDHLEQYDEDNASIAKGSSFQVDKPQAVGRSPIASTDDEDHQDIQQIPEPDSEPEVQITGEEPVHVPEDQEEEEYEEGEEGGEEGQETIFAHDHVEEEAWNNEGEYFSADNRSEQDSETGAISHPIEIQSSEVDIIEVVEVEDDEGEDETTIPGDHEGSENVSEDGEIESAEVPNPMESIAAPDNVQVQDTNEDLAQPSFETIEDDVPESEDVFEETQLSETATLQSSEHARDHTASEERDDADDFSAHVAETEQPTTPDNNPDLADIDIELFKSPMPEHSKLPEMLGPTEEGNVIEPGTEDAFPEWDLIDPGADQSLLDEDSPKAMKRPRVDEEFDNSGDPTPDLKRQRSE